MIPGQCDRQGEVLEIARSGGWPDRADDALLAHVATCVACGELVTVAATITNDFSTAVSHTSVPPAGAVWWRMQRRRRLEAEKSARRIVTALQALSIAAGVIAVALLIPSLSATTFTGFFSSAGDLVRSALSAVAWPLVVAGAAFLALTPVALVLALRD